LLLLPLVFALAACNNNEDPKDKSFDRVVMLRDLADHVIQPAYQQLNTRATALSSAMASFKSAPNTENLTLLRSAFLDTWRAWQPCSPLNIGPALANNLRTNINVFPTDTTRINNNIQAGQADLQLAGNFAAKGFPALDYLLFGSGDAAATAALFAADPNRLSYLEAIIGDLTTRIAATANAFDSGWRTAFVAANGVDVGSSTSLLLNEFLFDWEALRRHKIGDAIGIRFLGEIRPNQVEAFYSNISKELALLNGRGVYNIIFGIGADGTDHIGFDDYLRAIDAKASNGPLADALRTQMQAAFTALEAVPGELREAASANTTAMQTAYQEHQKAIPLIKADMTSALGVVITFNSNDGD
jgi:predicted lipoprotein